MKYIKPTLIIFFIAVFSFFSFSQILLFEKKVKTGATNVTDMVDTDDQSIIILCELLDSTWNDTFDTYFNHTLLYNVSLDGEIVWSKIFYNYTTEIAWTEKIIKTSDGNFLLFGNNKHDTHLLKINVYGDSLWTKSIPNQIPDPYPIYGNKLFVQQALETCDNDILILSNHDNRIIVGGFPFTSTLMKTDQLGNLLWNHSLSVFFASNMVINNDNNIVVCISKQSEYPFDFIYTQSELILEPSVSIGFQTFNSHGIIIKETTYPFISGYPTGMMFDSNQEILISARMHRPPNSFPSNNVYVPHSLIMKTDAFENEIWTRDYIGNIQSLFPLANNRLLALSWPYLKTINSIGDSVNGYQYSYELKHSQMPLVLISGNGLYQAGMIAGEDSLMISKIDASLISGGDYVPPDEFFQSLDMYPNPASNFLNIDLTSIRQSDLSGIIFSDEIDVFVHDITGRLVKKVDYNFINNLLQLQVDNLANGLYFFKISFPGMDVLTEKIMISH
ncbi:MAG: T9SS type A sorting domain-containing protein [Bacteroidales bacterium]